MKPLGSLEKQFSHYKDGVYYYDLTITIGDKVVVATVPRYHQFMGWIEIFGLPPQSEWVILGDVPAFSKRADLVIDGQTWEEEVQYIPTPSKSQHRIEVTRRNETDWEKTVFTETYTEAPEQIKVEVTFTHHDGTYHVLMNKGLVGVADLSETELSHYRTLEAEHGQTDMLWRKTFQAKGELPPVYYHLLPGQALVDISDCQGSVFEVGYSAGTSDLDAPHGSWYKHCTVNERTFRVVESDYASEMMMIDSKKEAVKTSYRKQLFG